MPRITRKLRERAADLCAVHANDGAPMNFGATCTAAGVQCSGRDGVADLARAAYWNTLTPRTPWYFFESQLHDIEAWAEAEAMLRSGWNPPRGWAPRRPR